MNRLMRGGLLVLLITAPSCHKNPVDQLVNPGGAEVLPASSGIYTVYDDELKTGGGLGFTPGGENQLIDLQDQTEPRRTTTAIRYVWNGDDVTNASTGKPEHTFAGFSLLITPDFSTFDSATGKDLSGPGYRQLKLEIRGSLSANTSVRIEGPDDGDGGHAAEQFNSGQDFTLSSDWQHLIINIPSSHFRNVKSFITVSFQYSQPPRTTVAGNGGEIFIDDIRYQK